MTAPEPTPTADEHTDAVALPSVRHIQAVGRALWETSRADEGTMSAIGADLAATAILTSTDPAVHSALLDALVRAGVLTEDRERLVRACTGQCRSRLAEQQGALVAEGA